MFKRIAALLICAGFIALMVWLLVFYIPGAVSEMAYITEYEELVDKYCDKYSLDKALAYSIIKTESGFNPDAVSDTGAIGLMQITEPTFDWLSWRLGIDTLKYSDLFEPENSVMYGCYLLSYLYSKYGSVELTAAAYHAGMGKVDGWIESGEIDPENVTAEDISGPKTSHYVEKILKAYKIYSKKLTDERN